MKFQISFKAKVIFFLSVMLLWANMVMAQSTITKPYTFRDGTSADAEQVNANFDLLYQKINELSAKFAKLESNPETGDVKGCNWEGWKCHCKDETGGTSGYVNIGMKCENGVLTDIKVIDVKFNKRSAEDKADCSEAAACQ